MHTHRSMHTVDQASLQFAEIRSGSMLGAVKEQEGLTTLEWKWYINLPQRLVRGSPSRLGSGDH